MNYCTQADLIERFGLDALIQATQRDGRFDMPRPDTPDERAVESALADATEEIDGYLRGKYTLPIRSIPKSLQRCAADIAFYYLHGNQVSDLVRERYEAALKLLGMICTGRVRLGVTDDEGNTDPINLVEGFEGTRVEQYGGNVFGGKY